MWWVILIGVCCLILLAGLRNISNSDRGVLFRFGHATNRIVGPGTIFVMPVVYRVKSVNVQPLSVSLPPQSAITKDEIPIQLQASLDAVLRDPAKAVLQDKDWRVLLMSRLQDHMKDRLEDLDFDTLDSVFPAWVASIRSELEKLAEQLGVEISGLQISNLSPRSRPS